VLLYVIVGEDGVPTSVTIKESSGYPILDRAALQWIKAKYRWEPGPERHYYVPSVFKITK
jgi:TonB family protein